MARFSSATGNERLAAKRGAEDSFLQSKHSPRSHDGTLHRLCALSEPPEQQERAVVGKLIAGRMLFESLCQCLIHVGRVTPDLGR